MTLDPALRSRLTLPAVCAPMFLVSGVDLVVAASKAGVMAGLPRRNARTFEDFVKALRTIQAELAEHAAQQPGAVIGPIAVNLDTRMSADDSEAQLRACADHGVSVIVSAAGDPTELTRRVHEHGLKIFHDVTTLRFAEKAIAAGVDGLTCIGAGGGGHSGLLSHLVLIPKVREMFDGTIIAAGAISTGAAIRAAEVLGADLAYLGTRFIATRESMADSAYKELLVSGGATDLMYTGDVAGVPANWMIESLRRSGLDPDDLPKPTKAGRSHDHLPPTAKPWKSIWSAGQGLELISDVPSVAELVLRLRQQYVEACRTPDMARAAQLPVSPSAGPTPNKSEGARD